VSSVANNVISKEIEGLKSLLRALDDCSDSGLGYNFNKAVELILNMQGRLIVTGMGKSGHIGRKISSTLASTGTLSTFVHAAEANHGDLGMISENDAILMISNSGQTSDLGGIINYATRHNIPLVSLTAGRGSLLDKSASIPLILPEFVEACTITNAPTTSCVIMLALGDALAVALLKKRGFTPSDFFNFHPGGKLGAGLKKIKSIMQPLRDDILCYRGTSVKEAVKLINQNKLGFLGVTHDGKDKLQGVITDGDLRRNYLNISSTSNVEEIMSTNPLTVFEDDIASKGLKLLNENKITSLFVLNNQGFITGIIHIHDFLDVGIL
jgi:arabinose-5-phosphate isomerase